MMTSSQTRPLELFSTDIFLIVATFLKLAGHIGGRALDNMASVTMRVSSRPAVLLPIHSPLFTPEQSNLHGK